MSVSIDQQTLIQQLQAELHPRLPAIYAFGSRVDGHAGPDSDLDIAVLLAGEAEPVALWELSQQLAGEIGCDFDLVDLRAASTVMQYRIITTGQRWWASDSQAALFETFVLSEKTRLEEARAGLLADIQREGRVHGR